MQAHLCVYVESIIVDLQVPYHLVGNFGKY